MSRAIVNVAVDRWFPRGQARLAGTLKLFAQTARFLPWCGEYPAGSPTHAEAPYAFKTFAIESARQAGYDSVLWLDASMWATRSLEPLWEELEEHGTIFWRSGFALGHYATDDALDILGTDRDKAMGISLVAGGIYGLDFRHERAQDIQDLMLMYARRQEIFRGSWDNTRQQCSKDPRCLGHRHDMVPLSALAYSELAHVVNAPRLWALSTDDCPSHPDAVIVARGM